MKLKELAFVKHDMEGVHRLCDKCLRVLNSCTTKEQVESANNYIMLTYNYILKNEHYDEYYANSKVLTNIRLFLMGLINKAGTHREFFGFVNECFSELWAMCSNKYIMLNKTCEENEQQ